jgi:quinol monooxygenase YgiN
MIVIAGQIRIDPNKREKAVAMALEMMEESRKEAGCISYSFTGDLADPARFWIFEEWESADALKVHFETPHMARFQAAIGDLGVQEMTVQRYEVSSVGPVF